jgi:2,3-bisphosphoglycerate-independent phosphoglycerate mutase
MALVTGGNAILMARLPLDTAYTPKVDRLASIGINGLYHSLARTFGYQAKPYIF